MNRTLCLQYSASTNDWRERAFVERLQYFSFHIDPIDIVIPCHMRVCISSVCVCGKRYDAIATTVLSASLSSDDGWYYVRAWWMSPDRCSLEHYSVSSSTFFSPCALMFCPTYENVYPFCVCLIKVWGHTKYIYHHVPTIVPVYWCFLDVRSSLPVQQKRNITDITASDINEWVFVNVAPTNSITLSDCQWK